MSVGAILLTAAVGCGVGLASGLLGIGGGVFIVPFLYFLFSVPHWSGVDPGADQSAAMAHATSLGVILPTALAGIREYRRAGILAARPLLPLGLGAGVFAVAGALTGVHLPSALLKLAFGVLLVLISVRLLRPHPETSPPSDGRAGMGLLVLGGGMIGFLSALLGIGGGALAIPLLLYGARLPVEAVAGGSLVVVFFAALGGVVSYGFLGSGASLPPGAWGYVFLPAAASMIPGAVLCAPLGARLNQRIGARPLRLLFGAFLLVVGARLVWTQLSEVVA